MSKPNGGPAFPVSTASDGSADHGTFGHQDSPQTWQFPGMTLRDYFAGQALAGMCSRDDLATGVRLGTADDCRKFMGNVALLAYELADAMLAERDK